MKRLFDITVSAISLLLLSPLFAILGPLIRLDSPGPVFFGHQRLGKDFRPFRLYKFRTMTHNAGMPGPPLTVAGDQRITRLGAVLRRWKLDELPQLFNVLKGEMSLVGPRPEVKKYIEMCWEDYMEILRVRPGITDMASIKYHDEASLLGLARDPEAYYLRVILPDKIHLAKKYVREATFLHDLRLILSTLFSLIHSRARGDVGMEKTSSAA